jgi:hypothetical protein
VILPEILLSNKLFARFLVHQTLGSLAKNDSEILYLEFTSYIDRQVYLDLEKEFLIETNGLNKLHLGLFAPMAKIAAPGLGARRIILQFEAQLENNKSSNMVGFLRKGFGGRATGEHFDFRLTKFMKHFIGTVIDANKKFMCAPTGVTSGGDLSIFDEEKVCGYSIFLELEDIRSLTTKNSIAEQVFVLDAAGRAKGRPGPMINYDYINYDASNKAANQRVYKILNLKDEDVVINLYPIEGDVSLYASLGSVPTKVENSLWKIESLYAKR